MLLRLRTLKDAASIKANLTKPIHNVRSVTHQPTDFSALTQCIYRGEPVERGQMRGYRH
jgi:hypothetical protein